MKPTFQLWDLLQQGDTALVATSSLLGQKMAVIDCAGVEFLTPGQLNLLFATIPETWDFMALNNETIKAGSLCDALAQQISEWLLQRSGVVQIDDHQLTCTATTKGIDKVLAFLPAFERRGAKLYASNPQQSVLAPYTYSSEVNGLLQALHDEGFILSSFNWGVWLDEANDYVDEPGLLASADLLTLQKLLTTHVRAERFNNGRLARLIETGHIPAILKRLSVLRQEMAELPLTVSSSPIRITATRGDITQQQVDAIVNTTNIALDVGGGVSEAIHAEAGPGLKEECRKLKGCAVGQAKLTHGYNLPAPWVIHTVGPIWQGGSQQEDELLARCYHNSLALAALCPIQTIAFPSISTGFHGFPVDRAARIAVTEVLRFLGHPTSIEKVIFVCRDIAAFDTYSKTIREITEFPKAS